MTDGKSDFKLSDIISLALATLFTFLILAGRLNGSVDHKIFGKNLIILSAGVSMVMFVGQYKALRKRTVFLAWTVLSLIMLAMFFWLHNDPTLTYADKEGDTIYNYANGLKVPFIILCIYALCRHFSKRLLKTELLLPNRSFDSLDYEENRHFNFMDYLWMVLSLTAIIAGFYY